MQMCEHVCECVCVLIGVCAQQIPYVYYYSYTCTHSVHNMIIITSLSKYSCYRSCAYTIYTCTCILHTHCLYSIIMTVKTLIYTKSVVYGVHVHNVCMWSIHINFIKYMTYTCRPYNYVTVCVCLQVQVRHSLSKTVMCV